MEKTNSVGPKTLIAQIAFLFPFALLFSIGSPGPAPAAGLPQMLGEILSKTEANYQNIHVFTATFSQKTSSATAPNLNAAEAGGRLYYAKPRQMRWEYDKPEEQLFVANNRYAWFYVRAENEITMSDAGKLFASPLARTFFDGALELKNYFDVTLDPIHSTENLAVLQLVPKQEDPNVRVAFLWIDMRNYRISRIQTRDILDNTNEISIDSFKPQSNLDPRLFHLDVPPGAKVIDEDGHELTTAEIEQLKARISSGR